MDRRKFGRLALGGALGSLVTARSLRATVHPNAAGIKLCAQSERRRATSSCSSWKQIGAEYVSVGSTPELRTAEGFLQIKALRRCRNHRLEHRQHERPQHAGGDAQSAGPRPEGRGVQTVPAQPRQSRHLLHDVRPHGQRHLDERPRRAFAASARSSIWPARTRPACGTARRGKSRLSTGASSPRKRSGTFTYLLAGGAGGGREQRAHRDPPDDPPVPVLAGVPAASSATLKATSGRSKSPTVPTSASACAAERGSKAQGTDRERSGRNDPLLRRRKSGRSISAT